MSEIADALGVTPRAVAYAIKKQGLHPLRRGAKTAYYSEVVVDLLRLRPRVGRPLAKRTTE